MSTPHCTFLFLKKENKLSSGLCYRQLKKCTLFDFGVNVFDMKVLLGTLFLRFLLETRPPFYVVIRATRRTNRSQGKGSTFLSQFKTLSIGPATGIEPVTSRSAVKRSTDWANPVAEERNKMASKFPFFFYLWDDDFLYTCCVLYHNAWRNNGM